MVYLPIIFVIMEFGQRFAGAFVLYPVTLINLIKETTDGSEAMFGEFEA